MSSILLDIACIVCDKTLQKINHDPQGAAKKMGKIANRRSRTPNWSVEEKQYLLELINSRKEIVVAIKNNGPNHYEEKDCAWRAIVREMAFRFGNKFEEASIKKVKTQWQNMKRLAREEIAYGGGVNNLTRQTTEVCRILDMAENDELKKVPIDTIANNMISNVEVKTERDDELVFYQLYYYF